MKTMQFLIEVVILRMLGVRFAWTVHNVLHHERHRPGWELRACRLIARVVDAIIVHCPAVVPTVAAAYRISPQRLSVVPHGRFNGRVDLQRDEARRQLGLAPHGRILLFFGWVRRYKGIDQLLRAFAELDSRTTKLIILGTPVPASLGEELTALAAADPRVETQFEFVEDSRLDLYIRASDVVVLPYRDTLTSGAAIHAASSGRPFVAPRNGCMRDFPDSAAILYDPEEPDGLRTALRRAVFEPVEAMGEAARAYMDEFPWTLSGVRTAEVYGGIMSAEPAAVGQGSTDPC